MLIWFLDVNALLREIVKKAKHAGELLESGDKATAKLINGYLKADYQNLHKLWEGQGFKTAELGNLGRHIHFGEAGDYSDIENFDVPAIEVHLERHARESEPGSPKAGFEDLLHPVIYEHAYQFYISGHYREAVLNSVVAVFDLIRERTDLDLDGANLVTEAFSLERGKLILSEIDSESGRSDQKGFMQIFNGIYLGVRNPKSHSLIHDLDQVRAAQYLVFASLLARRVYDAKLVSAQ